MSGVGPSAASVGAGALLPFTGFAYTAFVAVAVGLIVAGLVLRRIAASRS
ncbi:MAG: hypothetical protein M3280_09725 [Actinomycetota bacterium]|nr:hypothetical protein [Actinomycetota bacterium]